MSVTSPAVSLPLTSRRSRRRGTTAPVWFIAPAASFFAVFVLWPILDSIWISLHDWDGVHPMRWIGLGNYIELFGDGVFYTALLNNLYWLIAYMAAPVLGLAIALFLNQNVVGIRLYKSLFFFPFVISQVVVGLVFSWFFNADFGLLNVLLHAVGLAGVSLLGNPDWATFAIIIAGLWPQTAYCMILYLTGLTAVSKEVVEAARMDGARGWRMLRWIIIPQLRPATFIAVVVSVVGALRSFDLVSIMTRGGPFDSSTVLAYYMFEQTFLSFRYGYGASIAVVLFLIMDVYIAFFLVSMLRRERA